MSINYCCLIAKKEKILLAESTGSTSSWTRINLLLQSITKNQAKSGQIEIENEQMLTYAKSKDLIFICRTTTNQGTDRPSRFLEELINLLKAEFGTLDNIINLATNTLCLQRRLGGRFDGLIKDFETNININKELFKDVNNELDEIKSTMNKNIKNMLKENDCLDELLIKSKKLEAEAIVIENEAKVLEQQTRCLKPWMAYTLIFLLVCGIIYVILALVRCGNLSITCNNE